MDNGIYNGDCIDLSNKLYHENGKAVDLVVTSPPYNVDLGNNKFRTDGYNSYDDNKDHQSYIDWLYRCFSEIGRTVKEGGRICINIGDGKNGKIPTHVDVVNFMDDLGYLPFTHIIWEKGNCSNRCGWGSWMSASCPSFPRGFEHILVFSKGSKKLQTEGKSDVSKQEFIDWSYGLWEFTGETNSEHPAPFPEELPKRLIKMLSYTNATVLDPFAGGGTTLVASKNLGRGYIGFEVDKGYCSMASDRLED